MVRCAVLLGSLLFMVATSTVTVAHAQAAGMDYQLPRSELDVLLNALAAQSGIQILYDAKLLAGHQSSGLVGHYEVDAALREVLRGSGLEVAVINANTYVVRASSREARVGDVPAVAPRRARSMPATQLGSVYVSGLRQRHSLSQSAMPVTEITREQIDASGYATLFDLLKAQPGMQVTNQPEAMSSDSLSPFQTGASGAAAVALRRLGAKSTLLLVDGRRVAGYGLAQDTGMVVDLSGISLAMVERIEILRDGASALYGSDAIGGVVNIILRRNFSGTGLDVYSGISSRGDAGSQQLAARWGTQTDSDIGVFLSANYLHSDPLNGSRRDWYSLDRRGQGLADVRDVYSNPGTQVYYNYYTGQYRFEARPGCARQDLSDDGPCTLDRAKYTTLRTGKVERSVLGRIEVPISATMEGYGHVRLSDLAQRQQAGPSSATFPAPVPEGPVEPIFYPWSVMYAYTQFGPVKETTEAALFSLGAGLRGVKGDWHWDVDVNVESNRVSDRIDGLLRTAEVLDALQKNWNQGVTPTLDSLMDVASTGVTRTGRTVLNSLSAGTSGPLFELPGGTVLLNSGLELRREGIRQQPDATLLGGELLNQGQEFPVSAHRLSSAVFVKLDLPLMRDVQLEMAGRVDQTEGFSARASPTLAVRWNPVEALMLRATASGGYRVPSLLELNQPSRMGDEYMVPVPRFDGPCDVTLMETEDLVYCVATLKYDNNPGLRPELSFTTAYGAIWAPSLDFSISVDVYRSVRKNEIVELDLDYALASPLVFPDFLQRNEAGAITGMNASLVNIGRTITQGIDVELRKNIDVGRFGRVRANLGANYLLDLERQAAPDEPSISVAGYADQPRVTAVAGLQWSVGDWTTGLNLRYTGGYAYAGNADASLVCPQYKRVQGKCSTPAFTLANLNVTWRGVPHWSLTAMVNNVLDHTPRHYDEARGGFNPLFDDAVGRYYAVRATYRF